MTNIKAEMEQIRKNKIRDGILRFIQENGHEPTVTEIDACEYLPSARKIQRRYGGVQKLREEFGFTKSFQVGEHSRQRSKKAYKENLLSEKTVFKKLKDKYGIDRVHFHYPLCDDGRYRSDFGIFEGRDLYVMDIFYASTWQSFVGCVNIKIRKHKDAQSPVSDGYRAHILIACTNPDFTQKMINTFTKNKKNKVPDNMRIMSYEAFSKRFF